ncbi:hypothetical protein E2C01_030198 [Portunus trituberculatus]|uniref:Uncharacterized protein n=1 Tax=Portunus trituberculatus TaxID=210409 RepID=A0A5B7EPU1_PORTR|nr:hypothetical protein [Portunus trituberculatus]
MRPRFSTEAVVDVIHIERHLLGRICLSDHALHIPCTKTNEDGYETNPVTRANFTAFFYSVMPLLLESLPTPYARYMFTSHDRIGT